MGCEASQPQAPPPKKMEIYGDYLSQDTRTLLAICSICDEPVEFKLVDTLKKENMSQDYKQRNPNMTVPIIAKGSQNYIGSGDTLLNLLIQISPKIEETFFWIDQSKSIQSHMSYFQRVVRRNTGKLIQCVVLNKIENKKKDEKKIKVLLKEFFDIILKRYNDELAEQKYMTGENVSVVDIQMYIEISTILTMYDKKIPAFYAKLIMWYEEFQGMEQIKALDEDFVNLVKEWDLYYYQKPTTD